MKSNNAMKTYGDFEREMMKRHMEYEEKWAPLNRMDRRDPLDVACWIVGTLGAILIVVTVIAQIVIKFHH